MSGIGALQLGVGGLAGAILAYVGQGSNATLSSLGIRQGDTIFVLQQTSAGVPTSGSGGTWTLCGAGSQGASIYQKYAAAADLSARVNSNDGGPFTLAAYTGFTTFTNRGSQRAASGASRVGVNGFAKSGTHAGLIIVMASYGGTFSGPPDQPTGWTTRASMTGGSAAGAVLLFDRLYPANPLYSDNSVFSAPCGSQDLMTVYELAR